MGQALKHRVIGAGLGLIAATRADRWLAPAARGVGLILAFHRVAPAAADSFAPNALLSITPEHLDRTVGLVRGLGYDVVALDALPGRLAGAGTRPFVALTFDDGYRDNLIHAAPILARHDVPWTLFVTSDYADGVGRLWWVELEVAIAASDTLELDGRVLPARTPAEKEQAFAIAYRTLRGGPEPILRDTIARWCDDARIDRAALVRSLCLNWDELAELAADPRLTIGAHTLSHPMLAKTDVVVARREVIGSRRVLEARLGRPVRHFAYPVGDPGSAGPREFALAREAGYATAVTTRPGHLFPGHAAHLTALPRVSVNGLFQTEAAVRSLLSGLPTLAWNRGRRVSVG